MLNTICPQMTDLCVGLANLFTYGPLTLKPWVDIHTPPYKILPTKLVNRSPTLHLSQSHQRDGCPLVIPNVQPRLNPQRENRRNRELP